MKINRIPIPLTENGKRRVTNWLMDIVEVWPKFQGGPIFQLQLHRAHQKEAADEEYEKSRIPDNVDIDYFGFRMIECFQIEDFSSLEKGLDSLIGNQANEMRVKSFRESFSKIKSSILSGHWHNLGSITRSGSGVQFPKILRNVELPIEIDSINVSLLKTLPSVITIVFDVYFNKDTRRKYKELLISKYPPEYVIHEIYLPNFILAGSMGYSKFIKQKAILDWQKQLVKSVEKILFKYFKGVFYSESKEDQRMPYINIYSIKADSSASSDFLKWAEYNRFWLGSLGFLFDFETFKNDYMIFHWGEPTIENKKGTPYNLFLLYDDALQAYKIEDNDNSLYGLLHHLQFYLNSITTPISIISTQASYLKKVEALRMNIYRKFKSPNRFHDLNSTFNDYHSIQTALRSIERIKIEYSQAKQWIQNDLVNGDGMDLFELKWGSDSRQPRLFSETLLSQIEYISDRLMDHTLFIEKYFSKYAELLNVGATYNLQIMAMVLTIGGLVIGILSVLANWSELIQVSYILKYIILKTFGFN